MHILISNDDGIDAPGIRFLWETLLPIASKISIYAPDSERSAASHSLTIRKPISAKERNVNNSAKIIAYAINGSPADCVKFALEGDCIKPDVIVSGINNGPNVGHDTLYSGTIGAAMEGALRGLPAVAVSLAFFERQPVEKNYLLAANFIASIIEQVATRKLPCGGVLNVNVPNINIELLQGVLVTRVGELGYEQPLEKIAGVEQTTYLISGKPYDKGNNPANDVTAVMRNYISVSPLTSNLTDYMFLNELRQWDFKRRKY